METLAQKDSPSKTQNVGVRLRAFILLISVCIHVLRILQYKAFEEPTSVDSRDRQNV